MSIRCKSLFTLENIVSENRFPFSGRLVQASVGICRGKIKMSSETKPIIILQTFNSINEIWEDTNTEIEAYFGLPISQSQALAIVAGTIVWCFYVHKNHFIVLAECD